MVQDIKKKVEAVLFTLGKRVTVEEISKLSGIPDQKIVESLLEELKTDYEKNDSSLRLTQDQESWKMCVKEEYGDIVQNIVSDTELSKSLMETLAVIAWKHPTLQADVIHIRTNKGYDDLTKLEEMGFITRLKHGRTRKINLTEKFFKYFDLPDHKQGKEVLKKLLPEEINNKINATEKEIKVNEKIIEERKVKKELDKQKQEQLKQFSDSEKEIFIAMEEAKEN